MRSNFRIADNLCPSLGACCAIASANTNEVYTDEITPVA